MLTSYMILSPRALEFWHGYLYGLRVESRDAGGKVLTTFFLDYTAPRNRLPASEVREVHEFLESLT